MKRASLIIGLFLLGIVIGYFVSNFTYFFARAQTENKIKTFYELILPGSTAEVMSLKEESGMYRALVKVTSSTGVSYPEVYVTKDGKLLSTLDSTILLETSVKQIEQQKNFVNCLYGKGVRIYGLANQTTQGGVATLLQLNVLGRIYSPKLFVSCDDVLVQQCIDAGVYQVPSVVMGNYTEPGVKDINWFESKTGCKL